jgi:hypothetical protein
MCGKTILDSGERETVSRERRCGSAAAHSVVLNPTRSKLFSRSRLLVRPRLDLDGLRAGFRT